ncbi:asparaginase [Natranaerobius trueperi]|uniref:asparaginase n=1 Tax=Natranaerobius trueperi TaxID=759412 RepID=A0A226C1P2_9FIRM|nr:asparaginase [Natranaerobius trueperi]OWZ84337.1 L-asparaginase [Natranaerobius trueperi]
MTQRKVAVIFTGGTIAMKYDPETKGAVPAVTGSELCEAIPELEQICNLETIEFSNIPSPHMDPKTMFDLAVSLQEVLDRDDISGVVVTHGTDTMEETAYLLNCKLDTKKPVVVTGAMRNNSEVSPDGPKNLLDSVRVAASDMSKEKGVMVVMNEEIHSANEVTKTHTSSVNTFLSPFWGPLGRISNDQVIFKRIPTSKKSIRSERLVEDVEIIRTYAGDQGKLLDSVIKDENTKGIIIEGLGKGNVPPALVEKIELAISKNIPVVLTTRTIGGDVGPEYSYRGGGKHLQELGVILSHELSGQKARIKLMMVLGKTQDINDIKSYFNLS